MCIRDRHKYVYSILPLYHRYIHEYVPGTWHECAIPGTQLAPVFCCFYFLFFHPIYYIRPSILSPSYLLLIVVTQIRGHIAGSFSPVPYTVRALQFFSREDFSSSLVDSRRIVLVATLGALSSWSFFLLLQTPQSLQSWVSTIQTVVLTADVFQLFIK